MADTPLPTELLVVARCEIVYWGRLADQTLEACADLAEPYALMIQGDWEGTAKTIDHHVSSILEKLDVRSRTEAVGAAMGLGILKADA